ncbi:type II secretion system protein N [Aquicella lusitana]|uniref:Type II secretion system (T2SS) protein C n=1 Tax=Aquicella lusitana TaxID=254246 RepID=A0A370G2G6_9COXI|nr:type II secretion system protein N [Aquicella lusitana]RDI38057.1 type II secretion system (T2SS) protein C [Aquicella lusitana]VVC72643.1 hypothetical protein AQULUS_03570 [Aquicella lusitana]
MIINFPTQQRLTLGLCAALAVLLGFTFVYSITQWYGDWELTHQAPPPAPTLTSADATTRMIAAIPDQHLFGKSFTGSGEVPITNLQLRVTGIVKVTTEQNGNASKAYISIAGQPSKIYQVGDTLPYGVKIYEITPDAVILENDSQLEKLPLPREKLQFKTRQSEERL